MLMISTTRIAGATTKNTSAPHPSDAHGLRPTFCCTVRSCLGISAAMTNASTRQNAVCSSQPMKLKPEPTKIPSGGPADGAAEVDALEGLRLPDDLRPRRLRQLAAEEHEGCVARLEVAPEHSVGADRDVATEHHDRRPHRPTDLHVAAERDDRVRDRTVHGHVAAERHHQRRGSAGRYVHVLTELDLRAALEHDCRLSRRRRRGLRPGRLRRVGPRVRGPGDRQPQQQEQRGQRGQRQRWREDPADAVLSHGVTSASLHGRLVSSSEGASPGCSGCGSDGAAGAWGVGGCGGCGGAAAVGIAGAAGGCGGAAVDAAGPVPAGTPATAAAADADGGAVLDPRNITSAQRAHTQPHPFSTCRETKNVRMPSGTARMPNQSGGTHVPLTIGTSKPRRRTGWPGTSRPSTPRRPAA